MQNKRSRRCFEWIFSHDVRVLIKMTFVDLSSLFFVFRFDYSKTSDDQTVFENYQSIRWTPLTTSILETFYELAPIHLSCNGSDGNYSPKFNWKKEYRPEEPEQRDVPIETAGKCK